MSGARHRTWPSRTCLGSGGAGLDVEGLQGGLGRLVEHRRDALGGCALLAEDALRERHRLLVARPLGDALQLLVAADLQVLERERERGELARRVRVRLEERAP